MFRTLIVDLIDVLHAVSDRLPAHRPPPQIRDRLGRSAIIEAEMDKTLAQFDERLLLLESSIQPIHRETLKLTRYTRSALLVSLDIPSCARLPTWRWCYQDLATAPPAELNRVK